MAAYEYLALTSAGKKKKGATAKPVKKKGKPQPLTDEEKKQRMQISLVLICWSLIGTIVGLQFSGLIEENAFAVVLIGVVVAGIVTGILKLTYWK